MGADRGGKKILPLMNTDDTDQEIGRLGDRKSREFQNGIKEPLFWVYRKNMRAALIAREIER